MGRAKYTGEAAARADLGTPQFKPEWLESQHSLPFQFLSPDEFEIFCYLLLFRENPKEDIFYYGKTGDAGRDIVCIKEDGSVELIQCKKYQSNVGIGEIKTEISKLYVNLHRRIITERPDKVTFYVVPDLTAPAQDLINEHSNWIDIAESALKDYLKKEPTSELLDFALSWHPQFSKQTAIDLTQRAGKHKELVEEFFRYKKVIDSEDPKLSAILAQVEQIPKTGKLSATGTNLADVAERYRGWLKEKTVHLRVPGLPLSEELSIETNWIPLRAKLREDSNESFDAEFIAELYRLSVVTGTPGTGKSTLMNRLAHRLSASGKRVLLVRLPEVQKLWRKQGGFEDAILKASADNSGLNEEELRLVLSSPDYLLADGLDECNSDRANIAKELDSWVKAASRRSITRVVVTTRIGHEPGLLPGWKHTEISPLDQSRDRSSIQKYAKQLLNASLDEEAEVEKRLALLENQLETNKNASLAARNPLLLGFLVQLIAEGKSISQNRAELYRDIIKLAYKRPPLDREPIELKELKEREAQRILEIAGWKLLQEPELSADELIESLIEELESRDYTLREAEEKAEAGVNFWENRCIFERCRVGNQDVITFIHPTLGEYAAGRYTSRLDNEKLGEWLEEVRRNPRWREPILLAAGLGKGEMIVRCLLELDDPEEPISQEMPISQEIRLAATVLAELNKPSSELLGAVTEAVANRVRPQLESLRPPLESHIPHIAFQAANVALKLAKFAPDIIGSTAKDIIGSIAKSVLHSTNSWTRLAATGLALVCGEDYVDLDILKEVLDDIVTEPVQSPVLFKLRFYTPPKLSEKSKEYGEYGWLVQNQVLVGGFQLLLQKQPNIETAKQIERVLSQGILSVEVVSSLRGLLIKHSLENLNNRDLQEIRKEWTLLLGKAIRPDKLFAEVSQQKLLETLQQKKRTLNADRAILEAVLRVTDSTSESLPPKHQLQKPVALGILLRGMGWSKLPNYYWSLMSKRCDLNAVDAVFRGAIAAMDLNLQTLATEAKLALEYIQRYNLDAIESALRKEDNNTEQEWAWKQIVNLYKSDEDPFKWSLCSSQIPEVPIEPKWELAQELNLPARELVRALKQPSPVIVINATQLLLHGAGGTEAAYLVKKLFREETDLAPELRKALEYWVQECLE